MADYKKVSDALKDGADPTLLCMTCPWDRFCITPPSMTSEDVERQFQEAQAKDDEKMRAAEAAGEPAPMPTGTLVTLLATAGRDTACQVCPVLAMRLRSAEGGQLVGAIREHMQAATS